MTLKACGEKHSTCPVEISKDIFTKKDAHDNARKVSSVGIYSPQNTPSKGHLTVSLTVYVPSVNVCRVFVGIIWDKHLAPVLLTQHFLSGLCLTLHRLFLWKQTNHYTNPMPFPTRWLSWCGLHKGFVFRAGSVILLLFIILIINIIAVAEVAKTILKSFGVKLGLAI